MDALRRRQAIPPCESIHHAETKVAVSDSNLADNAQPAERLLLDRVLRRCLFVRYIALVADYDGTLAAHDAVPDATVQAIGRLKTSGRRAIVITGRRLHDLLAVIADPRLFDLIVAENGAVVYDPATREETRLANPPSKALLRALRARGVEPLEIGQVVVATTSWHRATVQDVVWELGLEAQVIGNRGAVMVLPSGINKATGFGVRAA